MKKGLLTLACLLFVAAAFAQTQEEIVAAIQKEANDRPNHKAWHELTQKYVAASGKVNYEGMKTE